MYDGCLESNLCLAIKKTDVTTQKFYYDKS